MTDVGDVIVTQADRDAAADACFFGRAPEVEREMRTGRHDADPLVQSFARHRLAGYEACREDAARALSYAEPKRRRWVNREQVLAAILNMEARNG